MKRILPITMAVVLLGLALFAGLRFRIPSGLPVSFDVDASRPFACQIFFCERTGEPFQEVNSRSIRVPEGRSRAMVVLPTVRPTSLRIDFGSNPGFVRLGRVRVSGRREVELDWNDFGFRNGIDRFDVEPDGTVSLEAGSTDPFAIHVPALDVEGRSRPHPAALTGFILAGAVLWFVLAGPGGLFGHPRAECGETVLSPPFLVLASVLVFARLALSARLPAFFGASDWDDGWFVNAAASMAGGNWLGGYNDHTLIKGCFGPAVLSFCAVTGLTFHFAETLLYLAGCIFSVAIVSRLVRNRPLLLLCFALLLFNPLSFSLYTWQRIYRNGMALWQVPLVFGCLFSVFSDNSRDPRRTVLWAVLSGFALWMFQNTREDGVWIWPFVLVCLACAGFRAWRRAGTGRKRAAGVLACLLPAFVYAIGNGFLLLANRCVYGVALRNDRNAGTYAQAMQDLYLIEPDPAEEARLSSPEHKGHYHNIYYSTLCKAYEASPTLAGARSGIDAAIDAWAGFDQYAERDLHLDHMLFAVRHGVSLAGHYASLTESEAFFGAVHAELSEAFRNGKLRRRGLSVSALTAPLRVQHIRPFLREWRRAIWSTVAYSDAEVRLIGLENPGRFTVNESLVPLFERMTGTRMVDRSAWPGIEHYVARANSIARAYSSALPWAALLALVGYALLSVLVCGRFSVAREILDWWLFATGILLSVLVHTACIALVSATTFPTIGRGYLASSEQLVLLFVCVVAGLCARGFGPISRRRRFRNGDDCLRDGCRREDRR